ncbi:hypothetical protein BCR36DRAFT_352954 [Piromyces finnis]|uniref:Nitrogen regulatory protein areA GATA-like domain-containing protein n=1 Tax=Piromyces finnis TaxID=1754191 RepID=A0A1Y1VA22_9FUNG|nr:hypothetical protein BCR36DRAFT_352954 [Piromyces finnis]|eukprot:ORX50041.1 hypothetical protein BCR36DRAFT_352954 [Piromyces finnis]
MPVLLHQQPVLTLALESFQDTTIDEIDIRRMWIIFTKCKDDIKNGFRLENISWRIWYKKYLNNTDIFSNNKIINEISVNSDSMVHSIDSSNSSYSTIEPIEVLKKCACGEQLLSPSNSSLSTPHSEYTCFDRQSCQHHSFPKQTKTSPSSILKEESPISITKNQDTIVKEEESPISITENKDTTTTDTTTEETVVEVLKESSTLPESELTQEIVDVENKEISDIKEEIVVANNDEQTSIQPSISSNSTTHINPTDHSNTEPTNNNIMPSTTIPPNCLSIEDFVKQQLIFLQQVYLQKQQQLELQKQQINANPDQIYQQQLQFQQWYNQQQQQFMSNYVYYYQKYLQQLGVGSNGQGVGDEALSQQSITQPTEEEFDDNEIDDDEEDDDDDYYYSDEEEEEEEDDEILDDIEEKESVKVEPENDDLFKKVATPTLKKKETKPSLLSAMIKENSYNEYKKTVEIIQKYDEDEQKVSNNIYSIKDYNGNCINSLNKNERRKRAPSFEDVRNARRLFEMHSLYPKDTTTVSESGRDDVVEYYENFEKRHNHSHQNTGTFGNPQSFTTINTLASQESFTVCGSSKTTHSHHSTKSQGPTIINNNRTTINNSVNYYLNNKKRIIYSN